MTRPYKGGGYNPVYLPLWYYLSGEALAGNDASQNINLPANAQIVELRPEGGLIYFSINGFAQASSGGYIPEDGGEIIGPLANMNSVGVWAATGTTVHIIYFRENAQE